MARYLSFARNFWVCSELNLIGGKNPPLNGNFLISLLCYFSRPKWFLSSTSDDIIKILINKDVSGRTVVHSKSCSKVSCNCPTHLAARSVDSQLGKLKAIFNNIGRLHDCNTVAHPQVKEYLKFIRKEQASRAIVSLHAIPLLF